MTNTIGDYVFFEDLPQLEDPDENHEALVKFLNEYNDEKKTLNGEGKILIGPMRVLQKRVIRADCKRKSDVLLYKDLF